MAFINKLTSNVIDIKLTSLGRELISQGKLDIKYFGLGDSEIDYSLGLAENNISFLKPVDSNPNLLSFVKKNINHDGLYDINYIDSSKITVVNSQKTLGFFDVNETTGAVHFKNPQQLSQLPINFTHKWANLNDFGKEESRDKFKLREFLGGINTINDGDILIIKFTNTTIPVNLIDINNPTPYLIYRVISTEIPTDTTLNYILVTVDRELPDFSTYSEIIEVGVIVLTSTGNINKYTNDDVLDAVFENNILSEEIEFPYWKLSILHTEEIVGVSPTNKKFTSFSSSGYSGFVSYIQGQVPNIKKLGVIHYSNDSQLNTYGESLSGGSVKLYIPTIMWHKQLTPNLGVTLTGSAESSVINGLKYHSLVDESGYVVGKVFSDLKLFVIEDQELLFALSYKANRSWTLPNFTIGFDENFTPCKPCDDMSMEINDPILVQTTTYGSMSEYKFTFKVNNINEIIAEALSKPDNETIKMSRLVKGENDVFTMLLPAGAYSGILLINELGCTFKTGEFEFNEVIQPTPTPEPTPTITPTATATPIITPTPTSTPTVTPTATPEPVTILNITTTWEDTQTESTECLGYYNIDRKYMYNLTDSSGNSLNSPININLNMSITAMWSGGSSTNDNGVSIYSGTNYSEETIRITDVMDGSPGCGCPCATDSNVNSINVLTYDPLYDIYLDGVLCLPLTSTPSATSTPVPTPTPTEIPVYINTSSFIVNEFADRVIVNYRVNTENDMVTTEDVLVSIRYTNENYTSDIDSNLLIGYGNYYNSFEMTYYKTNELYEAQLSITGLPDGYLVGYNNYTNVTINAL